MSIVKNLLSPVIVVEETPKTFHNTFKITPNTTMKSTGSHPLCKIKQRFVPFPTVGPVVFVPDDCKLAADLRRGADINLQWLRRLRSGDGSVVDLIFRSGVQVLMSGEKKVSGG